MRSHVHALWPMPRADPRARPEAGGRGRHRRRGGRGRRSAATRARPRSPRSSPARSTACVSLAAEHRGRRAQHHALPRHGARRRNGRRRATGLIVTTFVFRVRNVPAALYKALGGFATNGVNMTKLESYMVGGRFTATQFYADVEGHPDDRAAAARARGAALLLARVHILGTYPAHPFRLKAAKARAARKLSRARCRAPAFRARHSGCRRPRSAGTAASMRRARRRRARGRARAGLRRVSRWRVPMSAHDVVACGQAPRRGELRRARTAFRREPAQPFDQRQILRQVLGIEARLAQAGILGKARPLRSRPLNKPAAQHAISDDADAALAHRRQDRFLDAARHQRIFDLQRRDRMHRAGARDGRGRYFGQADMADMAGADQIRERAHRLLDRHLGIEARRLIEIDMIGAEPGQAVGERALAPAGARVIADAARRPARAGRRT